MSISNLAVVSPKAVIGRNVKIEAFTIIHDNVEIGENTVIGSHCEIGVSNHLSGGEKLIIGKNSQIRSHSVIYEGSAFGEKLITGHRVTIREKVIAGSNLQVGTLSDIQGHCSIGNYVRFHSNVHIGQKSVINDFVWIFPYVVLTNDPHPPSEILVGCTIEEFGVVATMSIMLPGSILSSGSLLGAHSSLKGLTKPNMVYAGSPAKPICSTDKIKLADGSGDSAYPWRKHFQRGYPEAITKNWDK